MGERTLRQPLHERGTALCCACERLATGVTTIELRPWDKELPERRYHLCDDCRSEPVPPIDDVLGDFARHLF